MPTYLVNWKAVNARVPEENEARLKHVTTQLQLVQQSLKQGKLKEWRTTPDGTRGIAIFEGNESELALEAMKYGPYFEFEFTPIMTAEQFAFVLKTVAQPIPV